MGKTLGELSVDVQDHKKHVAQVLIFEKQCRCTLFGLRSKKELKRGHYEYFQSIW